MMKSSWRISVFPFTLLCDIHLCIVCIVYTAILRSYIREEFTFKELKIDACFYFFRSKYDMTEVTVKTE